METNNQNPFSNFKKVTLAESKKQEMRANIASFIQAQSLPKIQPKKIRSPFAEFMFNTQRALATLVIVAGILGVVKSSEGAKMGDILYPVKVYLADPINKLFEANENKTTTGPNDVSSEATLKSVSDSAGSQESNIKTGSSPEEINQNAVPSARTMTFSAEVAPSTSDEVGTNTSAPTSLKTDSSIVLPSVGPTGATAVPESGRIKILYPDRYTVAEVGDEVKIRWENSLITNQPLNIHITKISYNSVAAPSENFEIASKLPQLSEGGSYTWKVTDDFKPGYYKIQIWPDGAREAVGFSEEFAIVKEITNL